MAASKTISANGSKGHHKFTLAVTEGSIDVANNSSPVSFTFKISPIQTGWDWDWSGNPTKISYSITIGNNTYTGTIGTYDGSSTVTLKSGSNIPIPHNSDGTKTINIGFTVTDTTGANYTCGTASKSDTLVLTAIPRASNFENGTSQLINGSTIDGGMKVRITKYVDTYYDKLVLDYFNIGNQQFTQFKTVLDVKDNDDITFTTAELNTIYAGCLPDTRVGFRWHLYTYTDSTCTTQVTGSSHDSWISSANIVTVAPTFSDFNYSDTNATTINLTKDSATIVKGYSTLKVSIPTSKKATANTRQTGMSHYIVDGETLAYSSSSEVYKAFTNYNKDNVAVYAVDARGTSSNVVNKSFSGLNKYVAYTDIVKNDNQTYSRSDSGVGEFVTISFSGTWWGNKKFGTATNALTNSISATYKYRISGSPTWSASSSITLALGKASQSDTYYTTFSYNGLVNGDLANHGFNVSNSYDILVTVVDALSSMEFSFSVHSGEPAIALYKNRASLGAKYDQTLGGNQFWGNTYLNGVALSTTNIDAVYPVGSIYLTVDSNVNPNNLFTGTTWEQIKDVFLLAAGNTYTNGATGGAASVTLTTDQIPSHRHLATSKTTSYGSGSQTNYRCMSFVGTNADYTQDIYTDYAGGGQAHNNMPPYLVVCVWKRTQ